MSDLRSGFRRFCIVREAMPTISAHPKRRKVIRLSQVQCPILALRAIFEMSQASAVKAVSHSGRTVNVFNCVHSMPFSASRAILVGVNVTSFAGHSGLM